MQLEQIFFREDSNNSEKKILDLFIPKIHKPLIAELLRLQIFKSKQRRVATKTRGDVDFSKRKIRAQKGSGRARLGSSSSPALRKGAVAHGPKATLRLLKMNKKAILHSKFSCLNAVKERVYWRDSFPLDSLSVSDFKEFSSNRKTLLIVSQSLSLRATKNLKNLKVIPFFALNVKDLLESKKIILDRKSIENFQGIFKGKGDESL